MPVNIVRVPPAEDGSKQGIDDYLARGGKLDNMEMLPFEGGWLPPKDWPMLARDALQGLAGEGVNTIAPNTESDPVAILALFLAAYGNMIGRGAHFVVEGDTHHCKLWPVLVGKSSLARKGTAQGRVKQVLRRIDEHWYFNCQAQGLSSGEGLIYHVRDRKTKERKDGETVVVDEGVTDKRLMLTEPEFAGPLTVMQREGNTLSVALRMAWDDTTLQTLTKNSPERSTGSHVTIAAHTNQEELLKHLTKAKLGGGGRKPILLPAGQAQPAPPVRRQGGRTTQGTGGSPEGSRGVREKRQPHTPLRDAGGGVRRAIGLRALGERVPQPRRGGLGPLRRGDLPERRPGQEDSHDLRGVGPQPGGKDSPPAGGPGPLGLLQAERPPRLQGQDRRRDRRRDPARLKGRG